MRATCSLTGLARSKCRSTLRLTPLEDRAVPAGYTTIETSAGDFGNDGVPEFVAIITRQFDNHDRLLSEVTMNDTDFDGTGDFLAHSLTQTFNRRGRLTDSVEFKFIDFLPGVAETITLHQDFNRRGDLTHSVVSTDIGADGTVDSIDTTNRTYDARRNLIRQEVFNAAGDGTINRTDVLVQEFNARGKLTSSVDTLTDIAFGLTVIDTVTNTYDTRGNLTHSVSTQDQGGDGLDLIIDVTNTYDTRGNLTESDRTEDFGADGVIDFFSNRTQEFDSHGNVTLAVITSGSDFGSQVESISQEFDHKGNVIHSVDSLDFDNDGVVDIQTTVDRTFDNHGNMLSQVTAFLGDGQRTLTQDFDGHGNLLSSVEVIDLDGDGVPESITSLTQEFNARGQLVRSVQAFDIDGDGVADNVLTHTFEYPGG